MSKLHEIHSGRRQQPPRMLIYGLEGIGKSTLAASAPKPIFIPTEDGLDQIECDSFPLAHSFEEVMSYLEALATESHDYQTVVIDSLDWLERIIWDAVCKRFGAKNIEKVDGGYGKGFSHALTEWRQVIDILRYLREEKGMLVLLLAHSKIEKFTDPESTPFDRFSPQQHCGGPDSPDVKIDIPDLHIECKRTERLRLYEAMEQATEDASKGLDEGQQPKVPVVCHRSNRKPWLLTVRLEDLPRLDTRCGARDTRPGRVVGLWPSHARADKGWTQCVYNLWFTDEEYRRLLANKLDLSFCPPYPEHVAKAGRGSSFDGLKYDGNAAKMAVLDRWRAFAGDPQYRRIVDRPELADLSESVCHFPNPMKESS